MYGANRRNNLDIVADILRVAQGGAKKTRIVYQANLNFKIIKRYLEELLGRKLLSINEPHYFTTGKGRDYLIKYEALTSL